MVNHIELKKERTYGRAMQVGIGQTGVQAIKVLKKSGWWGRQYSEMLEPFTYELFEQGKIKGTHFIEKNARAPSSTAGSSPPSHGRRRLGLLPKAQ